METVLPKIAEFTEIKALSALREDCLVELPSEVDGIVLWDCHDSGPSDFRHVILGQGALFFTGPTYRDEADLSCCGLDYFHPPRLLWAYYKGACYLVNGEIEVIHMPNCYQE